MSSDKNDRNPESGATERKDCCRDDFNLDTAYTVMARDFTALLNALETDAAAAPEPPAAPAQRSAPAGTGTRAALFRIVGGKRAEPGEFPSCVCVGTSAGWHCTGVAIHPRVVLTAAHCGTAVSRIFAGGEVVSVADDAEIFAVERVIAHPAYEAAASPPNDISILVLGRPLPKRMCAALASDDEVREAGDVVLAGFGYNDPVMPWGFGVKRWTAVRMNHGADEAMFGFSARSEFTAGRKHLGRDSCNGDSGGPAYVRIGETLRLAGLTARATRAATANCGDGGVYTRVMPYREWIHETCATLGIGDVP